MRKERLQGMLCVVLASMCYGITPILTNTALRGGLPAEFLEKLLGYAPEPLVMDPANGLANESFLWLSMLIACAVSLVSCLAAKKSLAVSRSALWQMAVFGGGCFTATMLLISYAYSFIPAGAAIVLNFTYPLLVAVASAALFKERLRPPVLLSLIAATVGVGLISGFSMTSDSSRPAIGILLALLSAVTYGAYFIAGRRAAYTAVEPSVANVYITASASLISLMAALATGRLELPGTLFIWIVLAADGILGYLIALRLMLRGIRLLGAPTASALNMLEPVFASLTSVLVFGEAMGASKLLGIALVLASAAACVLMPSKSVG